MSENELPFSNGNFALLEQALRKHYGADLSGYKYSFLQRRLEIALKRLRCKDVEELIQLVIADEAKARLLFSILTINVSSFFRNPDVFQFIDTHVLPEIFRVVQSGTINILSGGCSTGEETYSLAAMIAESFSQEISRVNIVGIDLDPLNIEKAEKGLYPPESAGDIPLKYKKFFSISPEGLQVDPALRKITSFKTTNIVDLKPENPFHMVIVRNVLIFLQRAYQSRILAHVLSIAATPAFLVLGKVESVPRELAHFFKPLSLRHRVYRIIKEKG